MEFPGERKGCPTSRQHPSETGAERSNAMDHAHRQPAKKNQAMWAALTTGWRFTRHLLEMVAAMIGGMVILMLYRRERYAHGGHHHGAAVLPTHGSQAESAADPVCGMAVNGRPPH